MFLSFLVAVTVNAISMQSSKTDDVALLSNTTDASTFVKNEASFTPLTEYVGQIGTSVGL